jgi:presenilin-like A22 family membrane protease
MYVYLCLLSIHNDICYLMYIINIMVDINDDVCGIETQDDWVVIELGDTGY